MLVLYCVNLAMPKLHFPQFPSLHESRLGLSTRNISYNFSNKVTAAFLLQRSLLVRERCRRFLFVLTFIQSESKSSFWLGSNGNSGMTSWCFIEIWWKQHPQTAKNLSWTPTPARSGSFPAAGHVGSNSPTCPTLVRLCQQLWLLFVNFCSLHPPTIG